MFARGEKIDDLLGDTTKLRSQRSLADAVHVIQIIPTRIVFGWGCADLARHGCGMGQRGAGDSEFDEGRFTVVKRHRIGTGQGVEVDGVVQLTKLSLVTPACGYEFITQAEEGNIGIEVGRLQIAKAIVGVTETLLPP